MDNEYFFVNNEVKTVYTFKKRKDIQEEKIVNGIRCVDICLEYSSECFAKNITNTYDIFYNTNKYKSVEEAEDDVYKVELVGDKFKIIEANKKEHWLQLSYEPVCGVDISDDRNLQNFINRLIKGEDNGQKL